MLTEIPVVDMKHVRVNTVTGVLEVNSKDVAIIGQAFRDIGFVFVRAQEISAKLPRIYEEFKKVFDLSEAVKAAYAHPEIFYQRGWTPPFSELGIACRKLGDDGKGLPDAKENWFIGRDLLPDHELRRQYPALYPENIWPTEIPAFKEAMIELYHDLYGTGRQVLSAVGNYLGKPLGYFDEVVRDSPTVMRAIHYPQIASEQVGKIIWACQHTDINLVTVLPASTREGLWIRRRDGEWIPGTAPEACVIVQVADMLDYLTAGYLISAAHEVRAPLEATTEGRYAAALFMHARSDVLFEPEADEEEKKIYPPITAGDLLLQRLRAIGLAV